MLAGDPVIVIWRSDEPSMALAILICAPDICRISLILVPWRPIIQPISWEETAKILEWEKRYLQGVFIHLSDEWLTQKERTSFVHENVGTNFASIIQGNEV